MGRARHRLEIGAQVENLPHSRSGEVKTPHILLPDGVPGIRGLFELHPDTAKPLCELADILLHEPNTHAGLKPRAGLETCPTLKLAGLPSAE